MCGKSLQRRNIPWPKILPIHHPYIGCHISQISAV
jgi:hypothetical protein